MITSTNQYQKPLTIKRNFDGNLEIGGCDTVELVEKFGTPLYVLDEKTVRSVCADYKKSFEKYPHTQIMYASKALCTSALAVILQNEGLGFDVVSGGGNLYGI